MPAQVTGRPYRDESTDPVPHVRDVPVQGQLDTVKITGVQEIDLHAEILAGFGLQQLRFAKLRLELVFDCGTCQADFPGRARSHVFDHGIHRRTKGIQVSM